MSHVPSQLLLPSIELGLVQRAAREAAPREACGVLLGRRAGAYLFVEEARELRNLCGERGGYRLDPAGLRAALEDADCAGLEVLGAWHSHPSGHPQLSAVDHAGTPEGWCQLLVAGPSARLAGAWWRGPDGMLSLALQSDS